jgi:pimeloyl-ACP methyl ester carboxylesterase
MVVEDQAIQNIPILAGYEPHSPPRPLIVLAHGFTRSKGDWRGRIPDLVRRGYFVAALDNRGHGKRPGPDFKSRAGRNGKWEILAIRHLIEETAQDIRTVIDGILRQGEADPARIGLAGVSMGAYAALQATAADDRIRAAVSILGSPYWDDVFAGSLEESDPAKRSELEAFAALHQPASFPDRFFPRAILFQTGEKDPHLKSRRVKDFCGRLAGAYASAPEKLDCLEFAGIGHEFTAEMWENTLEWFERFLQPTVESKGSRHGCTGNDDGGSRRPRVDRS